MEHDQNYLFMRAEAEEAIAAQTPDEAARDCHLRLAELYRRTAAECISSSIGDYEPTSSPVTPDYPEAS